MKSFALITASMFIGFGLTRLLYNDGSWLTVAMVAVNALVIGLWLGSPSHTEAGE